MWYYLLSGAFHFFCGTTALVHISLYTCTIYICILQDCVIALLSMLTTTIDHMDKDEVKVHSSLLLNIFTTALDYRATQVSTYPVL